MNYLDGVRLASGVAITDCFPGLRGAAVTSSGRVLRANQHVGYIRPTEPLVRGPSTPGSILAEMDGVLREAETLNADVLAHVSGAPEFEAFKRAWSDFFTEYKKFYADNSGWFGRLWGSVELRTREYGDKLNDYRAQLIALGGRATEPKVQPKKEREDPNAIPWKPVLIGGVVIAAIGVGGYALSKTGALAAVFKGKKGS